MYETFLIIIYFQTLTLYWENISFNAYIKMEDIARSLEKKIGYLCLSVTEEILKTFALVLKIEVLMPPFCLLCGKEKAIKESIQQNKCVCLAQIDQFLCRACLFFFDLE